MEPAFIDELIITLKDRFAKNMRRHAGIDWDSVQAKLLASPEKLQALYEMERTGGEPDVVAFDGENGELIFCDCSPESPAGRRSLCFDRKALDARKETNPLVTRWKWRLQWVLRYSQSSNIVSYKRWESSIRRRRAG